MPQLRVDTRVACFLDHPDGIGMLMRMHAVRMCVRMSMHNAYRICICMSAYAYARAYACMFVHFLGHPDVRHACGSRRRKARFGW